MALAKPKILVLGATGKIGNQTAHLLTQNSDVQVAAGIRSPEKAQQLRDRNIEIRHLDLDRHETLTPALEGIDRALLLTGYSVDMLKQSKAFIDAAKQAGVQHIVHIGASGAPTNEVAHWGNRFGWRRDRLKNFWTQCLNQVEIQPICTVFTPN